MFSLSVWIAMINTYLMRARQTATVDYCLQFIDMIKSVRLNSWFATQRERPNERRRRRLCRAQPVSFLIRDWWRGSHMTIELHAIECLLTIVVYRAGICMIKLFIRQSSQSALNLINEHEISSMGFSVRGRKHRWTHRIIAMFNEGPWQSESIEQQIALVSPHLPRARE